MNSEVKKDEEKDYYILLVLTIIPSIYGLHSKSQHLLFGNSIDWF